ncbi:phospholipase, partial [Klebsiella pneumoniae]|nr:phospholipase [Klebsiella pneumoniae]
ELVWTGPTTPFVSARRTEQALLQVISTAERTLFITSFVAYDVSTIVKALNAANERGVMISILLELSQKKGGSLNFD